MLPITLFAELPRRFVPGATGVHKSPGPPRGAGVLMLAAVWGLIAIVWGLGLPTIASKPAVRRRLDELEVRGIDPGAMFYSELPLMDDVTSQLTRIHRRRPDPLWNR